VTVTVTETVSVQFVSNAPSKLFQTVFGCVSGKEVSEVLKAESLLCGWIRKKPRDHSAFGLGLVMMMSMCDEV
jgi:hypothetical protein